MPTTHGPAGEPTPPRRSPWPLVAVLVALALLITPMSAAAAPPTSGDERPPGSATAVHRITLLTGDTVTLTELGDGRSTVSVAPEDRVGSGAIRVTTVGDHLYVVPAAAVPLVASGAFDRALFDVTALVEQGLGDGERRTLPLIVQYDDDRFEVVAGRPLTPEPEGSARTRTLTSISATAVNARKDDASHFWRDVTGRSPASSPPPAGATLRDGIVKVWLDGRVEAQLAESVAQIGAPEAWAAGFDGTGARVAVLDTGIDATHPDLAGQIQQTHSFVPGETVADVNGHGTHVASTVLGTGAASGGVERGVAPGAGLLVGKVLGDDGFGQDSWIIDGMEWAASSVDADVVNLSLGSPEPSDGTDPMSQALNALSEQTGTLFVVGSGNLGADQAITSPGSADAALTVGAVDATDTLAWFSGRGPRPGDMAMKPDLVAPGVDVLAARSQLAPGTGLYETMSGTSMATPHVAGAAAILAQRHPGWDAALLKDALMSSSTALEGATAYQVGSGRVDVPAAVLGDVSATGSSFFGLDRWPPSDASPITRTVTYRNDGDAPVPLDLSVDLRDSLGQPVPVGMVTLAVSELTVPAHGTVDVEVTLDPTLAANGQQYTGRLTATALGEHVAHTTVGYVREDERYDLTITAVDRAGEPALAYVDLVGGPAGYEPLVVDGSLTVRRPAGTYSLASWLEVDTGTDHVGTALLVRPEVVLDGDRSVALDAREAAPVTADVPRSPVEASQLRMGWFRRLGDLPVESNLLLPIWTDHLYATPTAEVTEGDFDFATRWRLRQPLLSVTADGDPLDVIVQPGSPLFDGDATVPVAVIGGPGSPSAARDLAGTAVVVERSDEVSSYDRAVAARDAGAVLLLVVNDGPTELSEWVGGPLGEDPGIPVAAVSGVEGARFLSPDPPAVLHLVGRPDTAWLYDLQAPHAGSIPADLAYAPQPDQLARVRAEYASDRPAPGAEFRYDFRPHSAYGVGFMESLSLPRVRTEWVSALPGTTWYQEAMVLDSLWDVRGVREALPPGARLRSRWFSPVVRPRIGEGYWKPSRSGAQLSINLPSFADSGTGHTGDMYGVATQRIRLYDARGRLLESANDQALWAEAPTAAAAAYRLVSTARRDPVRWRTSTRTRTAWRFWSREPAAGEVADLPLISLDFRVGTDLAGRVGPGPTRLRLSALQVAGADLTGRLVGARLLVSYDGGRRWRSVSLTRLDGESWRASIPRRVSPSGTVSLKASAWDTRGNRITQTVIGAYRLR